MHLVTLAWYLLDGCPVLVCSLSRVLGLDDLCERFAVFIKEGVLHQRGEIGSCIEIASRCDVSQLLIASIGRDK